MRATKVCTRCSRKRLLSSFHKDKRRPDGLGSQCKDCRARVAKKRYSRAAVRRNEIERATRRNLRVKYGLTAEDYNKMSADQHNVCAICQLPDERRRLAVDHCHQTGQVRGLLCDRCNRGIGYLRDSAEIALAAARYLARTSS